jgi:GlpG protein
MSTPATVSGAARRALPWISSFSIMISILIFSAMASSTGHTWEAMQRVGYCPADAVWRGAYWGLVTSTFVHSDVLHLGFNAYWLWKLGGPLELILGLRRFLALFLFSAFVSASIQMSTSDDTGIGASGVVYAVFGFLWVGRRHDPDMRKLLDGRVIQLFLVWLVLCVIVTYAGAYSVGNAAHVAGLLFGAAAAAALPRSGGLRSVARERRVGCGALAALGLLALLPLAWCPWSPTWLSQRAYDAHVAQQYERAIDLYTRVLTLEPRNAWAYLNRGFAYESSGDLESAKRDLDRSRAIDPTLAKQAELESQ